MPFALPEYEQAMSAFLGEALHELARADHPILGQIQTEQSPGALGTVIQDQAGGEVDMEAGAVGAELTLDLGDVRDGEIEALIVQIVKAAELLRDDMLRFIFASIYTMTEATGNVVTGKGPLTFEHVYEMLDKIEYSLTDDGKLSLPTIALNPETAKQLAAFTTEDQNRQIRELQQRKLEELLARRRSRRLP